MLKSVWQPRAQITFLAEYPSEGTLEAGSPFSGPEGVTIRRLVRELEKSMKLEGRLAYSAAYATRCLGTSSNKPSTDVIRHCGKIWRTQFLSNYGQSAGRHVIVPLGNLAFKSLGLKANKIEEVRGKIFHTKVNDRKVIVVPTLSIAKLRAQTGLLSIVLSDLVLALREAMGENKVRIKPIEELAEGYVYPRTIEEVKQVCDEIIAYTDPQKQPDPDKWPISVDTETNTSRPFKHGALTIMISFAWDDGKATAIILDHESAPYDPKEAWPHVERVLTCPKPKTFHNAKFDLQFLQFRRGCEVKNYTYDTMLAEHFLDEDRSGTYSLKVLTPLYCPEYGGYEELLHKELREKQDAFDFDVDQEAATLYYSAIVPSEGFEEDLNPHVETEDPNYQWVLDPQFPEGTVEEDIKEYRAARNLWFYYNAIRNAKARKDALARWRKVAKKVGCPNPKPKADTKKVKVDKGFSEIDLNTLLPYAAADADITRIIHKKQIRRGNRQRCLSELLYVMGVIYQPASLALAEMEFVGTRIDNKKLGHFFEASGVIAREAQEEAWRLLCCEVNLQAPAALVKSLQAVGFEFTKVSETTGVPSLDKEVLLGLQKNFAELVHIDKVEEERDTEGKLTPLGKLKLVEALIINRDASNISSKFLKGVQKLSRLDGKIHTSFMLHGTATGRLSSSQLNLQNLPKYMVKVFRPNFENPSDPIQLTEGFNVKSLLVPDRPGDLFFEMDISAAEIRVLAAYSEDQNLIKAIQAGADIHLVFLTKIKHMELEPDLDNPDFKAKYEHYNELKKSGDGDLQEFRRRVKTVVFSTLYGSGPGAIAVLLGDSSDAGVEAAKGLQNSWFKAFPSISNYIKGTHRELMTRSQVQTKVGRLRRFPMINLSSKHKGEAKRAAVNFKIQSTASDFLVAQMLESVTRVREELDGQCRLTVHDSISGTVPAENAHLLKPLFHECIVEGVKKKFPWMPVEYEIDIEVGPSYGETMPVEKYLATSSQQ